MDRSSARFEGNARRWIGIAAWSIVAGALAGVLVWWVADPPMSVCEKAVRSGDLRRGIKVCLDSHERSKDPRDLLWAARGYMYVGEIESAEPLARELVAGPLYGDAHGILSYVALRRRYGVIASVHAVIALVAHTLAGDERAQAVDAISLSQAAWKSGSFTAALEAADTALRLAQRLRDPAKEAAAQLARGDALRRMGDRRGATRALTSAIERATAPCDKAWAHLKRAMCWMEEQQEGRSLRELEAASRANRDCGSRDVWISVALNQARLLRWKDPSVSLARLDEVAREEGELVEILLLRGYLAADRGALDEADRYLAAAERIEPPDADWPWEIARARAELLELRAGPFDLQAAESHYRRAIAMVAALRSTARARSAYLVTSHRGPYDDLIALLARNGRWREVLEVILELDASDMLRATANESAAPDHASLDIDTPAPGAIATPRARVDDVLSAWRSRELVIVIAPSPRQIGPGRERAYRLRVADGEVTGEDVGDANTARTWAGELFGDPSNRNAARALGRMIVPPGPGDGTLHVLAIGALGKVPLAALRDDDGSVSIGRRPLVRVLGLLARGPESRGTGRAIIIADPRGDLPSAAAEGSLVAEALGVGAFVAGSRTPLAATRERLWAAHDAALLHVAGHVGEQGRWRALRLADGVADPAEMVQRRLAPRIAVLAGCGSAAALDEEGWGSIAAALLESGTAVVIATDRSIDDAASLSLMRDFYAQRDWRTDPARALARVQHAHSARADASSDHATTGHAWAAFSVLGRPPVAARAP